MSKRRIGLGLAIVCALGCGEETVSPVPRDADVTLGGGFSGEVLSGNRLVIRAADGRVLLEGLPPGPLSASGLPLVGFATRTVSTSYEMQFGAFKPTETAEGPWRVASQLRVSGSEIEVVDQQGEALAKLTFGSDAEGALRVAVSGAEIDPARPERATKLSWGFVCDAEDHFAGFGAQSWDADHRGQSVPTFLTEGGIGKSETDDYLGLWMLQGQRHSSHAPFPEYLSRRGYMMVAETDRRSLFALCSEDEQVARVEVDMPATLHLFDGPTPAAAIERATARFGRPRLPPLVAFAPWLDAVFGSENVRRVAEKLRDEGVPSSVIWTEDWRGGEWTGETYALEEEWEVDRNLYPDFEQVADDLHSLGFDFHVYFNPFIYVGTKAWAEAQPSGFLVKRADGSDYVFTGAKLTDTGMIDLDNPDARAWAVGKMQGAIALGADGWMNDFAEWLPTDAVTAAGPAYEAHNRYAVQWQQVAREAIDGVDDGTPRLFFGRSGWFGSPELVDVFWAGDQRTTMDRDDGLPTLIPMAIGLGVCGISTYGHDIAGYQSGNNPGSTKEVFFRWTSLGAWSPVMRTHHGAQPDKNWSWEKDDETIAHFRRYASLHMALVPTLWGLAKVASDTGMPIWRGLALHYPEDAEVWPLTDQVLLGEHVLIAPISEPGEISRSVYLPAGRWFPWQGGAGIDGPKRIDVSADVGEIPVFVRAGGIVPMFPEGVMTLVRGSSEVPDASSVGDDRVVEVFLGESGAFEEQGGMRYELEPGDPLTGEPLTVEHFSAGGPQEVLPPCGEPSVAPCYEGFSGGLTVHLIGPGELRFGEAGSASSTLRLIGGQPDRQLTLRLRY